MTYKVIFTEKPTFLRAVVTGVNSKENVKEYLTDIMRECEARGCFKVLIEERLDGPRLGTPDVIEIASEGSGRALGLFKAIAYVDVNAEGGLMTFAGTVASKRGLPVRTFPTTAEAEAWLESVE